MRSRARLPIASALTVTTIAALAGCAATPDPADDGEGGKRFEGQELTALFIQPHEGASEILAKEFEELTGAKVNVVIAPYDEVATKLTLDQQSGANTIDVADTYYVNLGSLAADGSIQDLTDWIESDDEIDPDDFIESIYDPYSLVDGRRYALPFDSNTHVLFYNTEILARNGFDAPPATWDEYVTQVETITANEKANGIYGSAVLGQKAPTIIGSSFANRLAGFGGSFLDEDGEPAIDSAEAIAAARSLQDVVPSALPTAAETAFDQGLAAFLGGQVAFTEFWTDLGVYAEDPESSEIVGKWGVTTLPVGVEGDTPRAALEAGFTWSIAANTEKTDLAREFVKFATSSETNLELITTVGSGIDPNRISSLSDAAFAEFAPEVQKVNEVTLDGALAWPTGPEGSELAQTLADGLSEIVAGADVESTLAAVQRQWEEILS